MIEILHEFMYQNVPKPQDSMYQVISGNYTVEARKLEYDCPLIPKPGKERTPSLPGPYSNYLESTVASLQAPHLQQPCAAEVQAYFQDRGAAPRC